MSGKNNQPSIMNIKSIPVDSAQNIESDVLEPQTFSQSECTFELAPKGFLHPGSAIVIAFENNATINNAFPYANIGIHNIVRRAVLRTTAGRVICDTDDWNHLQAIKSMYLSNSSNKEREQYTTGRTVDFEVVYDDDSATKSTEGYGIGNGEEYQRNPTSLQPGLQVKPCLLHSSGSTLQIKLHELFSYMKQGNQLPLFMLPDERIQIQLFWAEPTGINRLALNGADDAQAGQVLNIDRTRLKFIADYVFYDGKTMEAFRDGNKELTFEYFDYRLSKQSLLNTQVTNNVRNVGGNGMLVSKVYWGYEDPNRSCTSILGKFTNECCKTTAAGSSKELLTSNLFVNGEFLYPQFINNPARQFHNLKETGQMVPFVSRAFYSGQGLNAVGTTNVTNFGARDTADNFGGKFFAQGFLTRGLNQRVDNRGIDLHSSPVDLEDISGNPIKAYTQRVWLEVRRYITIKDGHLETYFV
tara:strand:+ start:31 stop:1440 length:1410 start_codon:yes stop_codon:yes gene_type:complete